MANSRTPSYRVNDESSRISISSIFLILVGILSASIIASIILPQLLPGYAMSILAAQPKVFWYISRGSAITAYFLLWLTMVFGVTVTNKLAVKWPGLAKTNELHQFLSILGLSFGLLHGLILLGDHYMNFSLWQIFVPFSTMSYLPLAVGLGQIGFYIWLILLISFYVRRKIGGKVWRGMHYASYFTYLAVLLHSLIGGTDVGLPWMKVVYWITGGLLLFFTIYRILHEIEQRREKAYRMVG
jgi:predicted ferric reductase